jgi:hypothetical protein
VSFFKHFQIRLGDPNRVFATDVVVMTPKRRAGIRRFGERRRAATFATSMAAIGIRWCPNRAGVTLKPAFG